MQLQRKIMTGRQLCVASLLSLIILTLSCTTVPITGRRQLNLIPAETMLSMSYQQYSEFFKANTLSSDEVSTQQIKNVGHRIQKAVEQYFEENGMAYKNREYDWEFNLVNNEAVNAWCMPGGKVVFYTGILPYTQNEDGIAVVMGHEIAHAVAAHGNERMSQMLAVQLGGIALTVALAQQPGETRELWMAAFGLGAQVGLLLPYSRLHEYEADRLGLTFMAMAGYDPNEAVRFWDRMAQQQDGKNVPEFISTHPSDDKRIAHIKEVIPEVMPYYNRNRHANTP
jgi:predicted Zn-dependent protease